MSQRVTIEALAEWLKAREDILLLGHIYPDGDAVGATLGLCMALKAMGKRAAVYLPGGMPRMYADMLSSEKVYSDAAELPFVPQTAFSVDVSEPARLGEEGLGLFESCPCRAVLDHHYTNTGFGQLYMLDGEAAAAGELAVDLIDALGVKLTREMAECLFVAISTDCGQFNYSNTRPRTFMAAARCVEAGIDLAGVTEGLYRTRSLGRTKLLGLVLADLEVSPDGLLSWARLTEDMLERAGALREDKEGIVNYLHEIAGVKMAVLAEERGNETKFSLRCSAPLNVARDVAAPLGGGGHDCAAGATLDLPLEPALQKVLALAREVLANSDLQG